MNELKVSLKRIAEDGFTRNDEILADASKALAPQMGFELLSDINKNLLTIVAHVRSGSSLAFPLHARSRQLEQIGTYNESAKRDTSI